MKYICDNCNTTFNIDDDIEVNNCIKCGKTYIRKESDGMKKVARIIGSLKGMMDVVIHQDGHIELLDIKGEYTISDDYETLHSREITELEYNKL